MEIKKQRKRISKGLKKQPKQRKPKRKQPKRMRGGNLKYITEFFKTLGENIGIATAELGENFEKVKIELIKTLDEATRNLFEDFDKTINNFKKEGEYDKLKDSEKTEYNRWVSFINTFFIYKCDDNKCEIEKYFKETEDNVLTDDDGLDEDEANRRAKEFMDKIEIYVNDNTKKKTFLAKDKCNGQSAKECQVSQSSQGEQKEFNVIVEFDKIFLKILEIVKKYIGKGKISTKGCSSQFKTMISLLRNLPNIDKNLEALVDKNIKDLERRYVTILGLIHHQCSSYGMSIICGAAAVALGDDISALYEKLKANSKNPDISDENLLAFIKMVVPIMIKKLINIDEFLEAFNELKAIETHLISPATTGGKKSSGTVRKEILGKLMKIYRIPNDKKEYVRHKGHLISVKQYKEEAKAAKAAKAANHAKPTKPVKPAKHTKKVILGKERCIYKVQGSKKDHIKHKGSLIPVADYKKLMGAQ